MLCNIMQHMKTFIPNGLAVNYGKSGLLNVIFGTASASRNGRLWETAPPWPKWPNSPELKRKKVVGPTSLMATLPCLYP